MNGNSKLIYSSDGVSFSEIQTLRGRRVLLDMGANAVLIVPRLKDGRMVLVVQKRLGSDEVHYEFPSGGILPNELPEHAAARELLEEIGASGALQFVMKTEPLSGLVKFSVYIYTADIEHISEANKRLDEHEEVETVVLSKDDLRTLINSSSVVDGYVLLGLGVLNMIDV